MVKKYMHKYNNLPVQIKASIWFLVCSFMQQGISLLTTPIFTRLLNTSEYGDYNYFNSWFAIIAIIVSLNIERGVYSQGLVKFEEDRDVWSSSLQGLTTFLVILWMFFYIVFRGFWNELFSLSSVQFCAMFLMIWSSAVFGFWAYDQRVDYKYKWLVIVTVLISVLKPLVGIILVVLSKDKVTARILGLVIVQMIVYLPLYFLQMRKGKVFFKAKYWKYALAFNVPLVPHYLSQIVLSSADRIMIKRMESASAAGIYGLAYSLASIMTLFNTAISQTLSPWVYKRVKNNNFGEIENISFVSLGIIAIVNIMLMLMAPEAVALFSPKSYHDAIWIIPPVAMSSYFMFSYDLFSKITFYQAKTKLIMFASVIVAAFNVLLNYHFIKIYGYIAAGYTTLACYILYCVIHYSIMNYICKKYFEGIRIYNFKKYILFSSLFLCFGIVITFTYLNNYIRYVFIIVCILIVAIKKEFLQRIIYTVISIKQENKRS